MPFYKPIALHPSKELNSLNDVTGRADTTSPPRSRRLQVLVVDDERVIADTLQVILSNSGHDAKSVYSAEDALALLSDRTWLPDFAIIDVRLPRMNGVELAILLGATLPTCRLSIISAGYSDVDIFNTAVADGHYFHILTKPVHPAILLELAASIMAKLRLQP